MEFLPQTDLNPSLTQGNKLTDINLLVNEIEILAREIDDHNHFMKVFNERSANAQSSGLDRSLFSSGHSVGEDPVFDRMAAVVYRRIIIRKRYYRHLQMAKLSQ